MASAKGDRLTEKELKQLTALYAPRDRAQFLARLDEIQDAIQEMDDSEFDIVAEIARRLVRARR